jgi:transcriptional regulator with XRE-family HTH domain
MQKASETLNIEFRLKLQDEFSRRLRSHERYSIRAFASYLELDSSLLSRILSGKKQVSEVKMNAISEKLGIESPASRNSDAEFSSLSLDLFAMVSDWYHYAILDLTMLKSFKPEPKWIAQKLGIQPHEAMSAVERLKRLGMLKIQGNKLVKGESFYTNYSEGQTSAALKEYQRQIIKKALLAIDNCPRERKDITSITIAANSRKLDLAKVKIKEFRRELCAFLEDGEKDSVYHLALQLYPVTELEN